MSVTNKSESFDEGIDVRDLLHKLWSYRWWILASIGLFTIAFALIAITATPIYRSEVVLVSAVSDRSGGISGLGSALGQLGGIAAIAGLGVGGDAETEETLAVLRSRQFTENFIVQKNLMPELFEKIWDKSQKKWKVDEEKKPTFAKAYKFFDGDIRKVTEDKKTGLITLRIDWRDRETAAKWANELVDRLNAEMRARAIAKADASISFLEKELTGTADIGTREAINRLIETQIKQRMLANVTQEYALRAVDKAMPADVDDKVSPKRRLLVAIGFAIGLIIGVFGVVFRSVLKGEL